MNKHVSKAEVAAAVPADPLDNSNEIAGNCRYVALAETILRATPRGPETEWLYQLREQNYLEAVAELKKVLGNV